MKHIFSPYRVCPLGAHVDHQHGLVTGFAIDKGVDLWYEIASDSSVELQSAQYAVLNAWHMNGGRVDIGNLETYKKMCK